jgi:hypothetical protein
MAKADFKTFLNVDYTQTGDGQLARNAKKRKMDTPTGNTNEDAVENCDCDCDKDPCETCGKSHHKQADEALSMTQRRLRSRTMKKYAARLKVGRKKASMRIADAKRLAKRAQRTARLAMAKKITKGIPKSELTPARKQEIEKKLDKMKPRISRLAKKMMPQIRKAELGKRRS